MEGYVQNMTNGIEFAFQRHVSPGGVVDLEEVYRLVGFKQGFKFDKKFVDWLQKDRLNSPRWKIVVTYDEPAGVSTVAEKRQVDEKPAVEEKPKEKEPMKYRAEGEIIEVSDKPLSVITPKMIAGASLRKARNMISQLKTKGEFEELLNLVDSMDSKKSLKTLVEQKLRALKE